VDLIKATVEALRSSTANEPRLLTTYAQSTSRAFRYKLLSGLLPTMSRNKAYRPDLYNDNLCALCRAEPETADHLTRCAAAQNRIEDFNHKLRDAIEEKLPRSAKPNSDMIADIVLLSGFSLRGFNGTLQRGIWDTLQEMPLIGCTPTAAATALLRACWDHMYEEIWKPRCDATITYELSVGITSYRKRNRPAGVITETTETSEAINTSHGRSTHRLGNSIHEDRQHWKLGIPAVLAMP
jgi:hypothetical protein